MGRIQWFVTNCILVSFISAGEKIENNLVTPNMFIVLSYL